MESKISRFLAEVKRRKVYHVAVVYVVVGFAVAQGATPRFPPRDASLRGFAGEGGGDGR